MKKMEEEQKKREFAKFRLTKLKEEAEQRLKESKMEMLKKLDSRNDSDELEIEERDIDDDDDEDERSPSQLDGATEQESGMPMAV